MEQSRESDSSPEVIQCPECGANNAAGTAFCTGCGVSLRVSRAAESRRHRRGSADEIERSRARQEFARVKGSVLTVRAVYWAGTAFAVVQLLLVYTVLARAAGDLQWLMQVLAWGQLAMMLAGALLVLRAPLVWSVVGAAYWTLNSVLNWWLNDFAVPPGLAVMFVMGVAFWAVVGQAARVQRLMAEHPDLQLVRKRIAPEQRVAGGVGDSVRERRRDERRRNFRSRLKLVGILAAVAVVGIGAAIWASQPPTVDGAVQRFAELWAKADTDAIGGMFKDAQLRRDGAELREDMLQRGWLQQPPALTLSDVRSDDVVAQATFSVPGGDLGATFRRDAAGWHLAGVSLPRVEVTALRVGIDAFRAAWQSKGSDALVAMFRPESQTKAGASLQRMMEKRGWDEQRPELGDASPTGARSERVTVTFAVGDDELQVRFEFWHPDWKVTGVRLPSE